MMTTLDLPDIYEKAANEIERRGRIKGRFAELKGGRYDKDKCRICTAGAILYVLGGDPASMDTIDSEDYQETLTVLASVLYPGIDYHAGLVYDWSDDAESDQVVIDGLRSAAAKLRAA